jgi:hypothetical protein
MAVVFPDSHKVHADASTDVEYDPIIQGKHTKVFESVDVILNVPGGQGFCFFIQEPAELEPASEIVPGSQGRHTAAEMAPVDGEYELNPHILQADASA